MNSIILIAAADEANGIGKGNVIPWTLKSDMIRFRHFTMGNVVVMGRKTYDSIGHALKGRTNVVVTKDETFAPEDVALKCSDPKVIPSLKEAFDADIYVIGGQKIYEECMAFTDLIYLTRVHALTECDRFFPKIPEDFMLVRVLDVEADVDNEYPSTFEIWKRRPKKKGLDRLFK